MSNAAASVSANPAVADRLPAAVRRRIEKLETSVATLTREVKELRSAIAHPGQAVASSAGESATTSISAPQASTGLRAAIARGEAAKVEWVTNGEVIPAKVLADKWGLTPQALGPAAERGEVFAVVIKRQRFYPREFLDLDRDAISAVTQALGELSPIEKLVFWKRVHGALGGKSVPDVLAGGSDDKLGLVVRLAESWAAANSPARGHPRKRPVKARERVTPRPGAHAADALT